MNAESLRFVGKRWFDEFCRITGIDDRSETIIKNGDKTEMIDLSVDKLVVKDIDIIHDESYDLDLETYLPIGKSLDQSFDIDIRVCKALSQSKTNYIWLVPIGTQLTIKHFNTKTKKLIERTEWGS